MDRSSVRIAAHPGEIDVSRLEAVEIELREVRALATHLKSQNTEILDLLHRMTTVAATEHEKAMLQRHAIENRVREMELAS